MKKSKRLDTGSLDDLIDELTAEAGSDDEKIWTSGGHYKSKSGCPARVS